ncbi:glycosyl transferase family 9 [Chloroherpeton thalassium ATCC 35110]|uniref:Glycosyl transferase family 9 n=1 Tax=Chloroherpeton thalassium (strain ATCC 35110 / GB-78) TaxID=517418 RepID=B3QU67_CHLT3|nr:glycosyltransferase family 9 protein [Chloroherpeton thalassium]ACF12865.1 glycosyl transferase family 9 [Chloroherpeton thalassium ATCC 35110]
MIWKFLRLFFTNTNPPDEPKKILVIREAAIGDVILITPFLKQLRKLYPKATIEYVVVDWASSILAHNSNIDRVYQVSNELIFGSKMDLLKKRLSFFSELAKKNYDIVFSPTTQLIYKAALLLFRNTYKIGFDTVAYGVIGLSNFMLSDYVYIDLKEIPRKRHVAQLYLEMLRRLHPNYNVQAETTGLEIFLSDVEKNRIDEIFQSLGWCDEHEFIAIAPSAGGGVKPDAAIKTAPPEKFVQTIRLLRENNPKRRFVMIGSKGERDYVDKMALCDGKNIINLCGDLTLLESTQLLKQSALLISNDSGVSHMASALKLNHIVLFGATDSIEFGPYQNPNAKVLKVALPCAPCRENHCMVEESTQTKDFKRPYCLNMITPEEIVEQAEMLLKKRAK